MIEKKETTHYHPTPKVEQLSVEEYRKAQLLAHKPIDVAQGSIVDLKDEKPVTNYGAKPCLMIWLFDRIKGKMVRTGHFPEVSKRLVDAIDLEDMNALTNQVNMLPDRRQKTGTGLSFPTDQDVVDLVLAPESLKDDGAYEKYRRMLKGISNEIVRSKDPDQFDIFLFGQNIIDVDYDFNDETQKVGAVLNQMLDHFDVTTAIRSLGISETRIHDHRQASNLGSDATLYIPENKTIYHYHRHLNDPVAGIPDQWK